MSEPDEEEKLQQLHDRGCKFWRFSLTDLEMGDSEQHNGSFFNRIFRSARNEATFQTEVIPCHHPHLEEVANSLKTCKALLDESDEDETQLILRGIYRLLVHCTGLLGPPDAAERARLLERADNLSCSADDRMMWLPEAGGEGAQGCMYCSQMCS